MNIPKMNSYFSKVKVFKYGIFLLVLIFVFICFSIRVDSLGQTKEAKQEFAFKYIEGLLNEYIDYYNCIPIEKIPEELSSFFIKKHNAYKISAETRISKDAWGNDLEYEVEGRVIVLTSIGPPDTVKKKGSSIYYVIDLSEDSRLSCK